MYEGTALANLNMKLSFFCMDFYSSNYFNNNDNNNNNKLFFETGIVQPTLLIP